MRAGNVVVVVVESKQKLLNCSLALQVWQVPKAAQRLHFCYFTPSCQRLASVEGQGRLLDYLWLQSCGSLKVCGTCNHVALKRDTP